MSSGPQALAAYLAKRKISPQTFAASVGAHRSQIYRALNGDRRPGLDLASAIEKATGGAVPATAWAEKPSKH